MYQRESGALSKMYRATVPLSLRRAMHKQLRQAQMMAQMTWIGLYLSQEPVVVYSVGKTASMAVMNGTGESLTAPVLSTHVLHPENQIPSRRRKRDVRTGWMIYNRYLSRGKKLKYLVPFREQIARSVSSLFYSFEDLTGVPYDDPSLTVDKVTELFLERYPYHDKLDWWFQQELRPALGIDVFDYLFPHDQGCLRINTDRADILLIKMEADQANIEAALSDFLGTAVTMERVNVGSQKDYSDLYRRFKQEARLPLDYVRDVYSSQFMQHFYTADEIAKFTARWTGQPVSTEA